MKLKNLKIVNAKDFERNMLKNLTTVECDILLGLAEKPYTSQRELSKDLGYSLGTVNQSIKVLKEQNYLDGFLRLTPQAVEEMNAGSPRTAIVLAAGLGLRMIPINTSLSKGLLKVNGEPLIERIISQLHEVGISKIYVVVGFMKEQYEYLIDKYGVELIVNRDYAFNNSIYSLNVASKHLSNSYIIPCDIWCRENPFRKRELYSWYMVSDELSPKSYVRVNRKNQLVYAAKHEYGNRMIGIGYLTGEDTKALQSNLKNLLKSELNYNLYWEDALKTKNGLSVSARTVDKNNYFEIDTYEQLRALDNRSDQLHSGVIELLAKTFGVSSDKITHISALKKGMTNRSFLFSVGDKRYIMRIPGEGTDKLINRKEEFSVYEVIKDKNICDNIIYLNAESGYKVTEFLSGARTCDAFCEADVKKCMRFLRAFHDMKLKVGHTFDIYKQLEFYESLWGTGESVYRDYAATKQNIYKLKDYIERHKKEYRLTHIDAVADNFLFFNEDGVEKIRLIDWEYSGMQDPDVDLAMFSIYSMYDKEQIDRLIESYYAEGVTKETRLKIYCYVALCGLLWSNWCEYKRSLGVEFGEYALRQYRYAKDFYKLVEEELANA